MKYDVHLTLETADHVKIDQVLGVVSEAAEAFPDRGSQKWNVIRISVEQKETK